MKRLILYASILLLPSCVWAAGGTCPSGATYPTTSTAATGALSTLSASGVTSCYFVAANGSDSNDGLSEATGHPWAHIPGMPNCAGNCASLTVTAGLGFIFRGGDTWHFGASTSPATGGTLDWQGLSLTGTSSHPLYIGVDESWYSGGSWARPIFTGDNPACGPPNVGGNCNLNSSSSINEYYVSSCAHQIGTGNLMVNFNNVNYATIDGIEMTGLCEQDLNASATDDFFNYSATQGDIFNNLYIHGWTHLVFGNHTSPTTCTGGSVCFNIFAFYGGQSGAGNPSETLTYVTMDGSDSDPRAGGMCYCDWWQVSYSVFNDTTQAIVRDIHLFHDNVQSYIYDNGHANQLEAVGEYNGANAIYNNVWKNLNPDGVSFVGVWLEPNVGNTDYFFNNVEYAVGALEVHNLGQNGDSFGTYQYFNNTIETDYSQTVFNCQYLAGAFTDTNNHLIDAQSPYSSPCNDKTTLTDVSMTNATATTDGYTGSQTYGYSPTSSGSPTVIAGTNKQAYCTAMSGAGLTAAATACQSDTSYACSYSGSGTALTCPARTPVLRPAVSAWDVGAYQFQSQSSSILGVVLHGVVVN